MGFALPGAIAASMVYPDKPIIGIAGDAGFLMNVQEMETAKRLNNNIVMMVWEDNEYGLIAWKQWAEFGHHTDLSFGNPKWDYLAKAFGWDYHQVNDSVDMKPRLQEALDHKGPSLVVVSIDYDENQKLTKKLGQLTCII
jgi:acetolactate synthase-1/2/3 large subunit